jgi:hypothetical protein
LVAFESTGQDLPVDLFQRVKLIKPKDYEELAQRTREVKRMLGGNAES